MRLHSSVRMKAVFVVVAAALIAAESLSLPLAKEGQVEDMVKRCLVKVFSKALSKADSQLDPDCRDLLLAGVKHAPPDKNSDGGTVTMEIASPGLPPVSKPADVKDVEALLKSVGGITGNPEDEDGLDGDLDQRTKEPENREKRSRWKPGRYHAKRPKRAEEEEDYDRSQESWGVMGKRLENVEEDEDRYHQGGTKHNEEMQEEPVEERSEEYWDIGGRHEDDEERDKRMWKPTHRYHHKKKFHKRSDEPQEPGEEDNRDYWDVDAEPEKRNWRPGRYHQRRHKRDEELLEDGEEPDEERSQESWDVDKRKWRPGRYHQIRHRRDEEGVEELPDEDRSQESWDVDKRKWRPGRYHQIRHRRDEEGVEEEPDEDRSQESWDVDKRKWRPGRYHQIRHKRDEEPEEERSQEYWDFDTGYDKRGWRPGRYHQRRHRRDEEGVEEEPEGERSQESWDLEKRPSNDVGEIEKRIWKPTHRYHHKTKFHKRGGASKDEDQEDSKYEEEAKDEDEAQRSDYPPAWYRRASDEPIAASNKMSELAQLLSYKGNPAYEEARRGSQQRVLTPQEEKELENLAVMDMELQKMAAKLHENA
ncbi:secretogranin-1 isoform X3 [Oryzias latipes]|uniref:secretogranin-1 isoform X3 n=1 Tax=Oryzias latipes TaxID=8090 RepID=UPI000CE266D8|nr:secretogranin-1 isoform X3 [Oryzias latipes]